MTESNNESQVVDYYQNARLTDEKVAAILAGAELARDVRKWKQIAFATAASLIVVTAVGGWLFIRNAQLRDQLANPSRELVPQSRPNETDSRIAESQIDDQLRMLPEPRYKFVAFRSHTDDCPACRATGEVFAGLKEEMTGRPVDFEQFELQKADQLAATKLRIQELNLNSHIAGKSETAFALLLSPGGSVVQTLDPAQGLATVRSATKSVIEQ